MEARDKDNRLSSIWAGGKSQSGNLQVNGIARLQGNEVSAVNLTKDATGNWNSFMATRPEHVVTKQYPDNEDKYSFMLHTQSDGSGVIYSLHHMDFIRMYTEGGEEFISVEFPQAGLHGNIKKSEVAYGKNPVVLLNQWLARIGNGPLDTEARYVGSNHSNEGARYINDLYGEVALMNLGVSPLSPIPRFGLMATSGRRVQPLALTSLTFSRDVMSLIKSN